MRINLLYVNSAASCSGDVFFGGLLAGDVLVGVGGEADGNVVPLAVDGGVFQNSVGDSLILTYRLKGVLVGLEIVGAGDLSCGAVCGVVPVVAVGGLAVEIDDAVFSLNACGYGGG